MSETMLRRLSLAVFFSSLGTMGFAGTHLIQISLMTAALLLAALLALGLVRSPDATGFSNTLAWAMVGTLGFAAWNLIGQPNPRWAHRAFIYTTYGGAAAILLLATALDTEARTERQSWFIAGGVYLATTVSIILIKSCFVERMMSDAA